MFNNNLEYIVEENSTSTRYLISPVWDWDLETWSDTARIMLIKNGTALKRGSKLVGIGELDNLFPTDQYSILAAGNSVEI